MFLDSDLTRSFIFDPSSRASVRNRYFSMGMNNGNFPLEISSRPINSSFPLNFSSLQNSNILSVIFSLGTFYLCNKAILFVSYFYSNQFEGKYKNSLETKRDKHRE